MAEISDIIDQIKMLQEVLGSSETVEEAISKYKELGGTLDLTSLSAKELKRYVQELADAFATSAPEAAEKFYKLAGEKSEEFKTAINEAGFSVGGLSASLLNAVPAVNRLFSPFRAFDKISSDANKLTAQVGGLTDKLQAAGVLKGPLKWAAGVANATDAAKNMENRIIANMAAAGKLDYTLGRNARSFSGSLNAAAKYSDMLVDIGNAMGMTADQVGEIGDAFMRLPGVFDSQVEAGDKLTRKYHMLDAALRVARGTGLSYKDMQEDLTAMTQQYGATVTESLQTISRMYNATQAIGLSMQDMRGYVKDTGNAFKFFGDNSSAALDIMGKFGPALKESGLGPAAVKEIVGGFTQGVAQMGVAQRAFLASQTGIGGGGLRGGLEIEEMLAGGRAGEVAEKVTETIKRLGGGRILTRKEAIAGGPGAAAQFEFQRRLLQQGPFGQLAKSPQEAAKMLEALAKGEGAGIAEKIGSGQDALNESIRRGTDLAESQNDVLIKELNKLTKIADHMAISNELLRRIAVGVREGVMAEPGAGIELQEAARKRAGTRLVVGEKPLRPAEESVNFLSSVDDYIKRSLVPVLEGKKEEAAPKPGVQRPGVEGEIPPPPPGMAPPPVPPPVLGEGGIPLPRGLTVPLLGPEAPPTAEELRYAAVPPVRGQAPPQRPAEVVAPAVEQAAAPPVLTETGQMQGPPVKNELTIRVLGKNDVLDIIQVEFDKFGNAIEKRIKGNRYGEQMGTK